MTATDPIVDRVLRLGRTLERGGIPVGVAATVDACRAVEHLDLLDRSALREGLRATLVKEPGHREAFDAAFDRLFPARGGRGPTEPVEQPPTPDDVARVVAGADELGPMAAALVDGYAGLDGEQRSEQHHVQRVLRAADLARMLSRARIHDPDVAVGELRMRIDELKRLVVSDVRGRLPDDEQDAIALDLVDIEFLTATRAELAGMRSAIEPLARKLATRLARKRRHRRGGRVNLRTTMRRSLATGGVPFDLRWHKPKPHRPDVMVLSDVSGSVADFSVFTLGLVAALSAELPHERSFIFVDAVDEITDLLRASDHRIEPWQLMRNTNVIGTDGHSHYGAVFEQFWDRYGGDLRPTTTLIVTGDARTNHRDTGDAAWRCITERCRSVYWLNPEPTSKWDTFDSEMSLYADGCSSVHEVRNLRQLVECIAAIV